MQQGSRGPRSWTWPKAAVQRMRYELRYKGLYLSKTLGSHRVACKLLPLALYGGKVVLDLVYAPLLRLQVIRIWETAAFRVWMPSLVGPMDATTDAC